MKGKFLSLFFVYVFFALGTVQASDSILSTKFIGAPTISVLTYDSNVCKEPTFFVNFRSPLLSGEKQTVNDFEQYRSPYHSPAIFILLSILLIAITYVKVAFENELAELMQSIIDEKYSKSTSKSGFAEIGVLSFALHINFITGMCLYINFFVTHYSILHSIEKKWSLLFLFFLFTFFYLGKLVVIELIGIIFELKEMCREYAYRFSIACKTLGLALIPTLFILYTSPKNENEIIFIFSIVTILFFVFLWLWRWLSTGYKFMYSNAYHFFIYVCSIEISMMFLFFKLFTKTII